MLGILCLWHVTEKYYVGSRRKIILRLPFSI